MGVPICSGAEEGRGPPGSRLLGGRWPVLMVTRQEGRCVLSGEHRLCGQLPAQGGPGQPCRLSCDILPALSHRPRRPGWVLGQGPPSLHRVGVTLL